VPTVGVPVETIMSSKSFARGVEDARAGRPPSAVSDTWTPADADPNVDRDARWRRATNRAWNYERGRQWGAGAPKSVPLFRADGRRPTAEAVRWYFRLDIL
jgi:hypothetical protein